MNTNTKRLICNMSLFKSILTSSVMLGFLALGLDASAQTGHGLQHHGRKRPPQGPGVWTRRPLSPRSSVATPLAQLGIQAVASALPVHPPPLQVGGQLASGVSVAPSVVSGDYSSCLAALELRVRIVSPQSERVFVRQSILVPSPEPACSRERVIVFNSCLAPSLRRSV